MATIYIQGPNGLKSYCSVAHTDEVDQVYLQGSSGLVEFTHKYGDPSYEWDGTDSCTAIRVCAYDSSHEEIADATISSEVMSAASCTTNGTTDYTATFSESWADPQVKTITTAALGHTYSTTKVNPTCTEQGYTVHRCERGGCGYSYSDTFISALGHTPGDWLYNPAPTELKSGIRYRTCTVCDTTTTTEAVFPTTAVNKSYFNLVLDRDSNYIVSAADVANMPSVVCLPMTDGDTPDTGTTVTHVYERGFGKCESLEELYIPANYTYIDDSAFYGCSNLRKVVFDNDCNIFSIGRSAFDDCTSLEVCSLPSTINYIGSNAFANTNNLIIYCESASKPAGWADDWVDDTVTVVWGCGCAYNEHDFDRAVTLPTCTAKGYTTYTCSKCGATYTHNYTAALGHISTSYPTVAATCTISGFKGGTYCSVCNAELTPRATVAPLGHNWSLTMYRFAADYSSCTATRKCMNDITHEETQTTKTITESVTKQPTCTTKGTKRYVAVFNAAAGLDNWADEAIKIVDIPATGNHTAGDWEITAEPTLISTGTRVKKCTGCGTVMATETIPKLDIKAPTIAATVELGLKTGSITYDKINVTLTNPNSMALDYTINYSLTSSVSSSVAADNDSGTIAANSSVEHIVIPEEPDLQYGGNKDTTFGNCRIYAFFDDYPSISATKYITGSTPEIEDTSATEETPEVGTYNLLAPNALTIEGWEFVDSGNITNEGYTKSEVFYAGGYLESDLGTVVPVLYKLFDSDSTDPDLDEPFFHVGQGTIDGVTCDKWRKIEADGDYTWTSTCKQYVYTNVIVSNNRFMDTIWHKEDKVISGTDNTNWSVHGMTNMAGITDYSFFASPIYVDAPEGYIISEVTEVTVNSVVSTGGKKPLINVTSSISADGKTVTFSFNALALAPGGGILEIAYTLLCVGE